MIKEISSMAIDSVQRQAKAMPNTQRTDNWRMQPLATALALLGFVAYSTWRVFENRLFDTTKMAK